MTGKIVQYLKRPSTLAFLAFAAAFWAAAGFVFRGAWALDAAPLSPDAATVFPYDSVARWWSGLFSLSHDSVIPCDIRMGAGSPYFWNELVYAVPCFLAALGVAYYLRGRGLHRAACYGGGLAFAFCGYTLTLFSAGHVGCFVVITYMPFAFGLADRAVRKGRLRHWMLLGATVAWAAARQPDMWMLTTELLAAYFVYAAAREAVRGRLRAAGAARRLLPGAALAAATCAAVGVPQFHFAMTSSVATRDAQLAAGKDGAGGPAAAQEDSAAAAERNFAFCTGWSMPPEDILEFAAPGVRGDSSDPRVSCGVHPFIGPDAPVRPPPGRAEAPYWGRLGEDKELHRPNFRQHSLYVGAATCALALLAVAALIVSKRRRDASAFAGADAGDIPFWAVAAALATLCALGSYTPFYKAVVFHLPFMDKFRAPVKFHHITELCLSVLSAYGLQTLLAKGETADRARKAGAVAAGALALGLGAATAWALGGSDGIAAHVNGLWGIPAGHPLSRIGVSAAAGFAGACLRGAALAACVALCAFAASRRNPPRGFGLVAVAMLIFAGTCDLAANDSRYLSVRDVSAARAADPENDALARDIAARPGPVFAYGLGERDDSRIGDFFTACRIERCGTPQEARYMFLPLARIDILPPSAGKSRSYYRYSQSGFRRIERSEAFKSPARAFVLADMTGAAPAPAEEETPAALKAARAVSLAATLAALAVAAAGALRRGKRRAAA